MTEIVEVKLEAAEHLLEGVGVAVSEGRVRGYTRTDLVQVVVARIGLHDLVDVELTLRAVADECHVADEYVPKLWKLVQVVLTQELSDLSQARILVAAVKGRTHGLGIQTHAAELVDVERTTEAADALLAVDCRAAVLALDEDVAEKERRAEDYQQYTRKDTVDYSLGVGVCGGNLNPNAQ